MCKKINNPKRKLNNTLQQLHQVQQKSTVTRNAKEQATFWRRQNPLFCTSSCVCCFRLRYKLGFLGSVSRLNMCCLCTQGWLGAAGCLRAYETKCFVPVLRNYNTRSNCKQNHNPGQLIPVELNPPNSNKYIVSLFRAIN